MGLTNSMTEAVIRWQSILQSKPEYIENRKSMKCISAVIEKPSASHKEETGCSVRLQGFLNYFIILHVP